MKISSISELKKEIRILEADELQELIFRLAKHNRENKELLHYMLFEADYEASYIEKIKQELTVLFQEIEPRNIRNSKKILQKMVRTLKKQIKYSGIKTTEIEILIYFCQLLQASRIPYKKHLVLHNLFIRQVNAIRKAIGTLEEDLQYDYQNEVAGLVLDC